MKSSLIFLRIFGKGMGVLSPIWLPLCGFVFALGAWISLLERLPLRDGIYFAWVTALTVGYGDISPVTGLARWLSLLIALLGIILAGILVAVAVESVKIALQQQPLAALERGKKHSAAGEA